MGRVLLLFLFLLVVAVAVGLTVVHFIKLFANFVKKNEGPIAKKIRAWLRYFGWKIHRDVNEVIPDAPKVPDMERDQDGNEKDA